MPNSASVLITVCRQVGNWHRHLEKNMDHYCTLYRVAIGSGDWHRDTVVTTAALTLNEKHLNFLASIISAAIWKTLKMN